MRRQKFKLACIGLIVVLPLFLTSGCATSSRNFRQEYAKAWKETIKSEAWKNAMLGGNSAAPPESEDYYAVNDEIVLDELSVAAKGNTATFFNDKYKTLVSKAYFKIIAEAEKSDRRLREEYERLSLRRQDPNKQNEVSRDKLMLAGKKYQAHREMLEGLKSWKILSEFGSDDLEFFQAEHESKVAEMMALEQSEEHIINFMVYKLADLYHFEE